MLIELHFQNHPVKQEGGINRSLHKEVLTAFTAADSGIEGDAYIEGRVEVGNPFIFD